MPRFLVKIWETYNFSQWYGVRIYPSGYGANHKGFVLMNVEDLEKELGDNWADICRPSLFRPEYAKSLKERLEGEDK